MLYLYSLLLYVFVYLCGEGWRQLTKPERSRVFRTDAGGDRTRHGQDGDMGSTSLGLGEQEKGQSVCVCVFVCVGCICMCGSVCLSYPKDISRVEAV